MDPVSLACALAIALMAGAIKGVVGFAMPMIFVSGLGSFMQPDLALAGLILPTLVTNVMQALRQGIGAAWGSIKKFRTFLLFGCAMLFLSSQLVRVLPMNWLFLAIGVPTTAFTVLQLFGWQPKPMRRSLAADGMFGSVAGFVGGLSGVWGPPTVAYLTALNVPKQEHMRIQGSVYMLGACALFAAHVQSGVMRTETLPLSMILIAPAVIGIWIGFKIQDRINQAVFRKFTLLVLLIAGLNLIRRGLMG